MHARSQNMQRAPCTSYLLLPMSMMTMLELECWRASSNQVVKWLKVSLLWSYCNHGRALGSQIRGTTNVFALICLLLSIDPLLTTTTALLKCSHFCKKKTALRSAFRLGPRWPLLWFETLSNVDMKVGCRSSKHLNPQIWQRLTFLLCK